MPLFFFSYSRADAADAYLNRFYEDLRREVSTRGGIDVAETAFRDVEQPLGTDWRRTTADGLGSCDVFVPIYSPSYFSSTICGQEWHAFSSRLPAGGGARSIAPVWWLPVRGGLPPVAESMQDTRDLFGAEYREYGLRYLMQLKRNEERYQEFLVHFSMALITAAAEAPPPRRIAELRAVPNAFATGPPGVRAERPPRTRGGPRKVTFVVAATGRDEMATVRTALDVYGDDWADWRPYRPDTDEAVVVRAQAVASTQLMMFSEPVPVDGSLRDRLDAARRRGEMVVLLVDPWVAALPSFRPLLSDADDIRSGHAVILAPWESAESLPESDRERARDLLYVCLGNWMDAGDHAFRDDIRSMDDFEKVLGQALVDVRARIVNRAEVAHRVTENGPRSRPILIGPEG